MAYLCCIQELKKNKGSLYYNTNEPLKQAQYNLEK